MYDLLLEPLHLGLDQSGPVLLLEHLEARGDGPDRVPELLPVPRHVLLDLDLILPLEVLEGEAAEDAVAHDEGEEADVGEEEGEEPPDGGEASGQAAGVRLLLRGDRPRALRPRI